MGRETVAGPGERGSDEYGSYGEESIDKFKEGLQGMIAIVSAEEFVTRPVHKLPDMPVGSAIGMKILFGFFL